MCAAVFCIACALGLVLTHLIRKPARLWRLKFRGKYWSRNPVVPLIDWSIDWLIDWLIDWFTLEIAFGRLSDWLIDFTWVVAFSWLIVRSIDWLMAVCLQEEVERQRREWELSRLELAKSERIKSEEDASDPFLVSRSLLDPKVGTSAQSECTPLRQRSARRTAAGLSASPSPLVLFQTPPLSAAAPRHSRPASEQSPASSTRSRSTPAPAMLSSPMMMESTRKAVARLSSHHGKRRQEEDPSFKVPLPPSSSPSKSKTQSPAVVNGRRNGGGGTASSSKAVVTPSKLVKPGLVAGPCTPPNTRSARGMHTRSRGAVTPTTNGRDKWRDDSAFSPFPLIMMKNCAHLIDWLIGWLIDQVWPREISSSSDWVFFAIWFCCCLLLSCIMWRILLQCAFFLIIFLSPSLFSLELIMGKVLVVRGVMEKKWHDFLSLAPKWRVIVCVWVGLVLNFSWISPRHFGATWQRRRRSWCVFMISEVGPLLVVTDRLLPKSGGVCMCVFSVFSPPPHPSRFCKNTTRSSSFAKFNVREREEKREAPTHNRVPWPVWGENSRCVASSIRLLL